MFTPILLFYGAGLTVTAIALLRVQALKHDRWTNIGAIVLWPFYWAFFGFTMFLNRRSR
jgi:hypothetical protein